MADCRQPTQTLFTVGPFRDSEHISLAVTDMLICYEMPFFAFAHWFAFSHRDYIDKATQYAGRMPFYYAVRDAFGVRDVIEDSRTTLRGGVSYRSYEPVEGGMHQGVGRDRRIRAGLRYTKGGRKKYWLPMPEETSEPNIPSNKLSNAIDSRLIDGFGYAPLLQEQADAAIIDVDALDRPASKFFDDDDDVVSLIFTEPDEESDQVFADSQKLYFGDYNYPCIDVSGEAARREMWDEEERILRDQRAAAFLSAAPSNTLPPELGAKKKLLDHLDVSVRGNMTDYGSVGQDRSERGKGRLDKGKSTESLGFYGRAHDEESPKTPSKSPKDMRFPPRKHAEIDMSEGQEPEVVVDGIRLRYTQEGMLSPVSSRPNQSGAGRSGAKSSKNRSKPGVKIPAAALETAEYPDIRVSTPSTPSQGSPHSRPSLSARPSSSVSRVSAKNEDSDALPPDAIDLVVEDPEAAHAEMAHERMKGEPAVHQTGQRKVYKREYVVEDEDGKKKEAEVRLEREENVEGVAPTEKTKVNIRDESDSEDEGREVEVTVVRSATPPPHTAIIDVEERDGPSKYRARTRPSEDDYNPWA